PAASLPQSLEPPDSDYPLGVFKSIGGYSFGKDSLFASFIFIYAWYWLILFLLRMSQAFLATVALPPATSAMGSGRDGVISWRLSRASVNPIMSPLNAPWVRLMLLE